MTALEQGAPLHVVLEGPPPIKLRRFANTFAKNSAANLSRLAVTSLVSIFLPAYLTSETTRCALPPSEHLECLVRSGVI
jgi:hypothetical protein